MMSTKAAKNSKKDEKKYALREMRRKLEQALHLEGEELREFLEDIPYDSILIYDKRMAKRIGQLSSYIYEVEPGIANRLEKEIYCINCKLEAM